MREYTDPATLTTTSVREKWMEPETDPTRIDWPARQAVALLPFEVIDGRPVSPGPASAVRYGRHKLGLWGENPMADALVLARTPDGRRHVLLIERGDGRGWAVPGGSIDPGEHPVEASIRELWEETGLSVDASAWRAGQPRYVPDPRGSDESWAVTVVNVADLGTVDALPAVQGSDDARRAAWVPAASYPALVATLAADYGGTVFPAHVDLLTDGLAAV